MVRNLAGHVKNPCSGLADPGTIAPMMIRRVRSPIVAGAFYPSRPESLSHAVAGLTGPAAGGERALPGPVGLIAPHAGYSYSGAVAGAGYTRVAALGRPEIAVLLGADHTGIGAPIALSGADAWATPLGESPVDRDLTRALVDGGAAIDDAAFAREHSIEVHLPFIQYLFGPMTPIVPVRVGWEDGGVLERFGAALSGAIGERAALVVASTDFTHYEPDAAARRVDRAALHEILALDPAAFLHNCRTQRRTICGPGAVAVLLHAARALGLRKAESVAYATSADATGDRSAVVAYASVLFTRETT